MASNLFGCGVKYIREFPVEYYYELDTNNKICGKWKFVNKEMLLVTHVRDMNLNECNGIIGFSFDEYAAFRNWAAEVQEQ